MRMTRAQAAAQAAAAVDGSPEQSGGPTQERAPLGELAANSEVEAQTSTASEVNGRTNGEIQGAAAEADGASSTAPLRQKEAEARPETQPDAQPDTHVHQDAASPAVEVAQLSLTPQRTPAKKLMKKDPSHMRSTSNKENIGPASPLPHRPFRPQEPLPEAPPEHSSTHQPEGQEEHAPAQQEGRETDHRAHNLPGLGSESHTDTDHHVSTTPEPEVQKAAQIDQRTASQPDDRQDSQHAQRPEDQTDEPSDQKTERQEDEQSDHKTERQEDSQLVRRTEDRTDTRPVRPSENEPETQTDPKPAREPAPEPAPRDPPREHVVSTTDRAEEAAPIPGIPTEPTEKTQPEVAAAPQTNGTARAPTTAPSKTAPTASSRPEAKKPVSRPSARPSSIVRSSSVRKSVAPKPEPAASAALRRATSVRKSTARPSTAPKEPLDGNEEPRSERGPANIPHSKPRPVSMSFPTPPPPPKSSKPPTKSTFQLPGEAIAAKLKAAREARMNKDGQEKQSKPPAFKARPMPNFKDSGATVRQTATSRARLQPKDATEAGPSSTGAGLKRASTVRESSTASTANKRLSTVPKPGPGVAIPPPRPSTSSLTSHKRTVSTPSTAQKPRAVSNGTSSASTAPQRVISNGGAGTKKGKEVFGRAVAEKETLDRQRREKEEAAKKARADAAERGRVASREWAAKMKLRKDKGKENTAVAPTA